MLTKNGGSVVAAKKALLSSPIQDRSKVVLPSDEFVQVEPMFSIGGNNWLCCDDCSRWFRVTPALCARWEACAFSCEQFGGACNFRC